LEQKLIENAVSGIMDKVNVLKPKADSVCKEINFTPRPTTL